MGFINLAEKTIHAKLVYYGVGSGGKTTSLQAVHSVLCPANEVKLVSINTEEDATLLFDFLPINLGHVEGFKILIQGFTVPGQPKYKLMRKYVLQGADAVVLVVDSQSSRLEENLQALEGLKENLILNGLDPNTTPIVMQYNKRDLEEILAEEELDKAFCFREGIQSFPSVATDKQGVFETFVHAAGLLVDTKVGLYGLGQGEIDPKVVAEGARKRLWEVYDEVRHQNEQAAATQKSSTSQAPWPTEGTLGDDLERDEDVSAELESVRLKKKLDLSKENLGLDYALQIKLPDEDFASNTRLKGLKGPDASIELDLDDGGLLDLDSLDDQAGDSINREVFSDDELNMDLDLSSVQEPEYGSSTEVEQDDNLLDKALQSNLQLAEAFGELDQLKAALSRKNGELVKVAQNTVHDLNKPLSAIKLMLSSAAKGYLGELQGNLPNAMDNALVAVKQMERLLGDLMDSSRLDFDGVQLSFQDVDMTLLVADVVRTMRFQIEEEEVGIRLEPLPVIQADEWALNKAFMNLLGNAMQYACSDRPTRIRVYHQEVGEDHVFYVEDNGIGIPEACMPRLFQRFERGANTAGISGTGLGLHIVKEVTQGHSGFVTVESTEGEGTCFAVHIPKSPVQAPHSQVSQSTSSDQLTS